MKTPPDQRCIKCRNFYSDEKDFNKLRAIVLTKDRLAGNKMIQIKKGTEIELKELGLSGSYEEIIMKCIEAYKENNDGLGFSSTILEDKEEE